MLQETVGETLGFSDTRTLSEWSRGLVGAAAANGIISGYEDGSFQDIDTYCYYNEHTRLDFSPRAGGWRCGSGGTSTPRRRTAGRRFAWGFLSAAVWKAQRRP